MNAPVIAVRDLHRSYTQGDVVTNALDGVDFEVAKGELIAVQGTSGSGKSTLLHILGLLDRPTSGEYLLHGASTADLDDDALSALRNRTIGFVFQNFYLIPYATALENVLLPGLYGDASTRDLHRRALELLERVGLADRAQFTPDRLSGGQQQRVALARALFNEPSLLLADEPTGQLDSATSAEILDMFEAVNAAGTTVIMVTHDAETAARARRRILFRDGRIIEDAHMERTS